MKWGDRNTKIFHGTTVQRRERNKIQRLKDRHGEWQEGQEKMFEVVMDYFGDIYTSLGTQYLGECIATVPMCVKDKENAKLCKQITDEEI